ncbi:MAG: hypothetical protein GY869_19325, partial [Planctomycetes bacterium]|nr:hypothetical protein [Planctomycetota bacterium]
MDGGVSLTSRSSLPAADYLGLSIQYLATSVQSIQDKVFIGDSSDNNGWLLYPDGEPRFRVIYVNGGSATNHGRSLSEIGRQRIRDFYYHGGSYVGSCAGAFISSLGYHLVPNKNEYLHIWPGVTVQANLSAAYTDHQIPADSPLLRYYDFGGDNLVARIYHNMGCYIIENDTTAWAPGTEVLARFAAPVETDDTSWDQNLVGNVSCWAHKKNTQSGRLVPIGSHPESITSGERRDLMAAIFQYALAGQGNTSVKSSLQNQTIRYMNDNGITKHERIGDKQYHHFTVNIPAGITQLNITINGDDVHDLDLFARKDDFAFQGKTGVIEATNNTDSDETITINNPTPGIWHIGVKGYTTVTTTLESWGQDYTGNLEVLNGQPYSITASWDAPRGDMTIDGHVNTQDLNILSYQWLDHTLYPRRPIGLLSGHWKFDEPAGSIAPDSSGMSHPGTLHNDPVW